MFLQWGSTVYVPRMGKDPWRFARNEMSLRPASPTLTHTRNTDRAYLPAGRVRAEQAGPRVRWPLPWSHCLLALGPWHKGHPCMSLLASGRLGGSPVLGTILRGRLEKVQGLCRKQGTKASLSSPYQLLKLRLSLCVMLLPYHSTTGRAFVHILRLPFPRQMPVQEPGTAGWPFHQVPLLGRTSWA